MLYCVTKNRQSNSELTNKVDWFFNGIPVTLESAQKYLQAITTKYRIQSDWILNQKSR